MNLTHLDQKNNPKMVDVGDKEITKRRAVAKGKILMSKAAFLAIKNSSGKKGSVIQCAIVASVMGVKKCSDLIPMCHPLNITGVECDINELDNEMGFSVECEVKTEGKTGVEMEALTGATIALLTIYDMVKAIDKNMIIDKIQLLHKSGGKSGEFNVGSIDN